MRVPVTSVLAREPVRAYVYTVTLAAMALAVAYGLVSATMAPLWLALAQAVLVVPATELARAVVTSPATAHAQAGQLRDAAHVARHAEVGALRDLHGATLRAADRMDPATRESD